MDNTTAKQRGASVGAIFLTVFIDLVGFSIIFPLFPAMLQHYLPLEGSDSLLGQFVAWVEQIAPYRAGQPHDLLTMVLFGGVLGSLYSFIQFIASPIWGRISDRIGRRPVLLMSISGTCISYLLWAFSGQFWLLVASRFLGGLMAGNLSVATAAIADVTDRKSRTKGMALVGIAFAFGFVVGPAIGGFSSLWNMAEAFPAATTWGINPFSFPAFIAAALCVLNLLWVYSRLGETLPEDQRKKSPIGVNPFARLKVNSSGPVRRVLGVYFAFLLIFSGMEFTLTFLALERLNYGPQQNTYLFLFIGFVLVLVQGGIVRRMGNGKEKSMGLTGVVLTLAGMVLLGWAGSTGIFYTGLFFMAAGMALFSPTMSSLVSLYADASEQGSAMGAFRAAGSFSRAIGPFIAAAAYWALGSRAAYVGGALILILPLLFALTLPQPSVDTAEHSAA